MPGPKLTPEERLRRGRAAFDKFKEIISKIDNLEGQERGRAYRAANSQLVAIKHAVTGMANERATRYGASDSQKREAQRLIRDAENMYDAAWKRHHK